MKRFLNYLFSFFFENSQGSVEVNAVLKFDTSATVSDSDVQNSVENSATVFDGKYKIHTHLRNHPFSFGKNVFNHILSDVGFEIL